MLCETPSASTHIAELSVPVDSSSDSICVEPKSSLNARSKHWRASVSSLSPCG